MKIILKNLISRDTLALRADNTGKIIAISGDGNFNKSLHLTQTEPPFKNMKPIEFNGQTKVLAKPSNMSDAECAPLAILELDGTCISCWKMTWRERLKAFFTGVVWVGVLSGRTQPPIYATIDKPFKITIPNEHD